MLRWEVMTRNIHRLGVSGRLTFQKLVQIGWQYCRMVGLEELILECPVLALFDALLCSDGAKHAMSGCSWATSIPKYCRNWMLIMPNGTAQRACFEMPNISFV